jgi:hypothetical protein
MRDAEKCQHCGEKTTDPPAAFCCVAAAIDDHVANETLRLKRRVEELEKSLAWALQEIRERSTGEDSVGTPDHSCEFETDPDRGKCDFHEGYWSAFQLLSPQEKP